MSGFLETTAGAVKEELPWLVFKLHNLSYTINSRIVTSILQLPENITPVASAPDVFRGVYNFRGDVLPLLDLRKVFGMKSLAQETADFENLVNEMKDEHNSWVSELERCIEENGRFSLPLDSRSCKLGRWCERVNSSINELNPKLVKKYINDLTEPHNKLHSLTASIINVKDGTVKNTAANGVGEIMKNLERLLQLLDDLFAEFINSYHEMIVVASDGNVSLGLIVDEVVAVDRLDILSEAERFPSFQKTKFFTGIAENTKIEGEILLVNETFLLGMFDEYRNAG